MSRRTRKKALEYKEFREWKQEKERLRKVYENVEAFHKDLFKDFKEKVVTGEKSNLNFMQDPIRKISTLRMVLDELDDTMMIMNKIPSLQFKSEWDVRVLPNFMGSFARFMINGHVSVYLDFYDRLAYVGKPYWEVHCNEGLMRFALNDTVTMMDYIAAVIEKEQRLSKELS